MLVVETFEKTWRSRLDSELSSSSPATRETVLNWLLGSDREKYEDLTPSLRQVTHQAMDYRYRILLQRYLNLPQERAYKNLLQRLGNVFVIRNKIRTWISLSRDRQRSVLEVLEEVIQELLQTDSYMQSQLGWISKCTQDTRLRNALLLASLEEYCLRPIRNTPLLAYRFVNYLRRSQRGGMTHVPAGDFIRLISEEIATDDGEGGSVSLLDNQAVADYQEAQEFEQQQELRNAVQQEFETYLVEKVDPQAAEWLQLYLQGSTQEAIALTLGMPVQKVYRLREKITYHAVRVFAAKYEPELVATWLGTSVAT
jgi:DNA-directed RNA polymerase specialized sigma24 family protein